MTDPSISIDRASKTFAVFDEGFRIVREFESYVTEEEALRIGRAFVAERTTEEPRIVFPKIDRMTYSTRTARPRHYAFLALCMSAAAWAAPFTEDNPPLRPEPTLTPGSTLTVPIEKLVVIGYANKIGGGVRHTTQATKNAVFKAYFGHVPVHKGAYEIDHLISLELGGADVATNLWPETYDPKQFWNAHRKDKLEDWMAADVRHAFKAKGTLAASEVLLVHQTEIRKDWIAAYLKYIDSTAKAP